MSRPRPKTIEQLKAQCIVWNHEHPIGTEVQFRPVIGGPEYRIRRTRTLAEVLGDHTAVIWLEGESGCVALDACTPINVGVPTEAQQ